MSNTFSAIVEEVVTTGLRTKSVGYSGSPAG